MERHLRSQSLFNVIHIRYFLFSVNCHCPIIDLRFLFVCRGAQVRVSMSHWIPLSAPPSQEPAPKAAALTHRHLTLPLHPLALEERRRGRKDMVVSTEGHLEQGMLWAFPGARTPGSQGHPLKWAGTHCKNSQMHTGKFWPPHPSLTRPPCLTVVPSSHPVIPQTSPLPHFFQSLWYFRTYTPL